MHPRLHVDGVIWAEAIDYQDGRKSEQENSWNGVKKTEDVNVCGGYRTESFGIIVWKRYDKKNRTDPISVYR